MQNIKLLDLQTGKYLELGERGFFYGGDTITCPPIESFIIKGSDRCLNIYADNVHKYDICELNNVNIDDGIKCLTSAFEITLKSNNQKFVGVPVSNIDDRFNRLFYKTEPQEPLKTLCEKTGAVVYGGRYVLLENEKCGNIYCEKNKWGTVYYLNKNIYSFIPCLEFNPQNDKKQTVARFFSLDNCQDDLIGNIFEEYSKQLRNEPNKFEELINLYI